MQGQISIASMVDLQHNSFKYIFSLCLEQELFLADVVEGETSRLHIPYRLHN